MTEQQTPASVVAAIERVALWANYQWTKPDQIAVRSELSTFTAGDLRAILAHVERLSAEREGLREALEPFVQTANQCPQNWPDEARPGVINLGHCRKARAALSAQGESRQTGWIDHDGGPNPVPGQQVEDVVWKAEGASAGLTLDNIDWRQVTAYRIALPAAPTPAGGGGE